MSQQTFEKLKQKLSYLRVKNNALKKQDLRIVFLGTPQFAVESLDSLIESGYNIVGVITAPDRIGGRGRNQLIESAVKKYAFKKGLKILQPKNLKNTEFLEELISLDANLQIIVAFRMLPEVVWSMPELGTYNLHGSLLPQYRGAAPINWAIIKGEEFTGVTTFKLKHEIDTGSMAYQEKVKIEKDENVKDLHDKLMTVGAKLILKTVKHIHEESLILSEQDESKVSKAPKIFHKDCQLDFEMNPFELYNYIRGLSPYPAAWTMLDGKKIKVLKSTYSFHHHKVPVGTMISNNQDYLGVTCNDGLLFMEEIQPEGKRRMFIKDFLNGTKLRENMTPPLIQMKSPWTL